MGTSKLLLEATKVIENSNYLNSSVSQGGTNNHNLTIPSGLSQVKLMIYYMIRKGTPPRQLH